MPSTSSPAKQKCSRFSQVINRSKKGWGAIYEGHSQERFIRVWPSDGFLRLCTTLLWLRISAASNFLIDSLALQSTTTVDTKGRWAERNTPVAGIAQPRGAETALHRDPLETATNTESNSETANSLHSFWNVTFCNENFLTGTWLCKNGKWKRRKIPWKEVVPPPQKSAQS